MGFRLACLLMAFWVAVFIAVFYVQTGEVVWLVPVLIAGATLIVYALDWFLFSRRIGGL